MSIQQLIADIEAWNEWAAQVNQRALTAGLVSAAELAANRRRSQLCLGRLRTRLDKETGPSSPATAWPLPDPTPQENHDVDD